MAKLASGRWDPEAPIPGMELGFVIKRRLATLERSKAEAAWIWDDPKALSAARHVVDTRRPRACPGKPGLVLVPSAMVAGLSAEAKLATPQISLSMERGSSVYLFRLPPGGDISDLEFPEPPPPHEPTPAEIEMRKRLDRMAKGEHPTGGYVPANLEGPDPDPPA